MIIEEDNRITVGGDDELPLTEVVIVRDVFFVRHKGNLLQIPAEEVPCMTYDPDERRINIICEKAPEDMREHGIPVENEEDAQRLTHILILAVQKYHEAREKAKRSQQKRSQQGGTPKKVVRSANREQQEKPSKKTPGPRRDNTLLIASGVFTGALLVFLLIAYFVLQIGAKSPATAHQAHQQSSSVAGATDQNNAPWKPQVIESGGKR